MLLSLWWFPRTVSLKHTVCTLGLGGGEMKAVCEIVVNFVKRAAEISNANLIRNANYILSAMDVESSIQWVRKDKKIFDNSKYSMSD